MTGHLLRSKSPGTNKAYYYYFMRWKNFIRDHGYCEMPAQPVHIALYLNYLLDNGGSIYSIKWAQKLVSYPDPTDNSFVLNLQESAQRIARKSVNRKDPVTSDIVVELCEKNKDSCDLLVRDLLMILFGYSGFLRFDKISSLTCKDISVHDYYLTLYIERSKTDQYRDGNSILISKGSTVACPYKCIYVCILYAQAAQPKQAVNSDVSERCIKRHGRWSRDTSKDIYIVDSVENRLKISQKLACPVAMLQRYFSVAEISHASDHFLFKPVFRSDST
ncbi:hypothetical protein KUTeg_002181, partial [Tegillarca granosa]